MTKTNLHGTNPTDNAASRATTGTTGQSGRPGAAGPSVTAEIAGDTLTAAALQTQRINRHYVMGDNIVRALDEVDITIERGEFVMIVGSSGSGKSTLMHVLGCLDTPTGGRNSLCGHDVSGCSDQELSAVRNRRVGFVFQQFNLLNDLTVLENIALPLAYSGVGTAQRLARARKQAESVGLAHRVAHHPSELSGGEAQRVAIARALVGEPEILMADEPTGNLDSTTGGEIMQALVELNRKGLTVVMVTHDSKLAAQGTRKVTMRDGKIISDETLRDKNCPVPTTTDQKQQLSPGGLGFFDLVRIGVKEGLLCHKMRTALTMLGIVIGVAAVIAMSSLSLGSKQKQANQIRALGANLMVIIDKKLEGEALSTARKSGSKGLSLADLVLLRDNIPELQRAAASRSIKVNCLFENRSLDPRVLGTSGDYLKVNNLSIAQGRNLSAKDAHSSARVAVLGAALARQLNVDSPLGSKILLGGDPYLIVGILADKQIDTQELEATSRTDSNYDLLIPLSTLLNRTSYLEMRNEVDELHLQLYTEDRLYDAGTKAKRLLHAAHNGVEDFQIVIPLDLLKQKQQAQRLLDILTILISSIALIVGGIGIMNIMLAAVTERIREIGIRRAVGATRTDIRYQFLAESVLISIIGGLIGVVLAVAATIITCHLLDIPIVISPIMVAISVTAATLVGLVFGLYPAVQAANMDPVAALRSE